MSVSEARAECLGHLERSLRGLEATYWLLRPVADVFAHMERHLQTYLNGHGPHYKDSIRWIGFLLHVFLNVFDGSPELIQKVNSLNWQLIKTHEDFIVYATLLSNHVSPQLRPVVLTVEKAMKRLQQCGTSSAMPAKDDENFRDLVDVFAPIHFAVKQISCAWPELRRVRQAVERGQCTPAFVNPVYLVVMKCIVPMVLPFIEGPFLRWNSSAAADLSEELKSMLAYQDSLYGLESSCARFYLMNLPDHSLTSQCLGDIPALTANSQKIVQCLLCTFATLMLATQTYEETLMPIRLRAFESLGADGPSYKEFHTICTMLSYLGRTKCAQESNIEAASKLARSSANVAKLSVVVADLCHLRGHPEELQQESRNAAYILWKNFVTWLAKLRGSQYRERPTSCNGGRGYDVSVNTNMTSTTRMVGQRTASENPAERWAASVFC